MRSRNEQALKEKEKALAMVQEEEKVKSRRAGEIQGRAQAAAASLKEKAAILWPGEEPGILGGSLPSDERGRVSLRRKAKGTVAP